MISYQRQQKATEVVEFVTLHYRPVQLMIDFSGRSNSRFERRVFCLFTTCCTFKGIKLMLENRAIPEDVDVNEVLAKVVPSIKYQAFGRAALTDEVDKMLREEMVKSTQLMEICQLVEMTRVSSLHLSIPTRGS
ncbi:hypothetical protein PsorP6_000176 [Peronosclerospora sorghi]|uniref:Uncharacterized protein n=1 Tax=Peronosclerospora sorghi TaxID=230839 RepID=A0ACC0WV16_9STRA|nr:hypothetical protein PsorP6_000176 [Peronosclerospora sorghi]